MSDFFARQDRKAIDIFGALSAHNYIELEKL